MVCPLADHGNPIIEKTRNNKNLFRSIKPQYLAELGSFESTTASTLAFSNGIVHGTGECRDIPSSVSSQEKLAQVTSTQGRSPQIPQGRARSRAFRDFRQLVHPQAAANHSSRAGRRSAHRPPRSCSATA